MATRHPRHGSTCGAGKEKPLRASEHELLLATLRLTCGNQDLAARALGISLSRLEARLRNPTTRNRSACDSW